MNFVRRATGTPRKSACILRHREAEVRQGKRIVDTRRICSVVSYASRVPFEIWLLNRSTTICSNSRAGLEPAQSGGVAEARAASSTQVASAYHLVCTLRQHHIQ